MRPRPSTRATNARASRTCPGTAGIVMLSRTAGTADADIRDTDPPWPEPIATSQEHPASAAVRAIRGKPSGYTDRASGTKPVR